MKISLAMAAVTIVGSTISSFTWIPPTANGVRNWMNAPMVDAVKEQTKQMGMAKRYDIRTDELADDVRDLKDSIRFLEKSLLDDPQMPVRYRNILRLRLESDKKKLFQKDGALDRATAIDQQILTELEKTTA